jgi:hypothetical protein
MSASILRRGFLVLSLAAGALAQLAKLLGFPLA